MSWKDNITKINAGINPWRATTPVVDEFRRELVVLIYKYRIRHSEWLRPAEFA